jgi:hypothetical protein
MIGTRTRKASGFWPFFWPGRVPVVWPTRSMRRIKIFCCSQVRCRSRHPPFRPKAINCGFEVFPGGRLGENVIKARRLALGSVHFVGMARYCDQHFVFQLLVFTKKSCDVNAIHFRQSKVQQNYVREMGSCGFESRYPIIGDVGLVTLCVKQTSKRVRRIVRIINDENARQMWHGRRTLPFSPWIV